MEIFYCNTADIENKLKVMIQMSLVLTYGARTPLVRILRGAGQYAKPRSKPTEVVNGEEILAYRGDNINGFEKTAREHDPKRLLEYLHHLLSRFHFEKGIVSQPPLFFFSFSFSGLTFTRHPPGTTCGPC